jgi:hypothetical protein
MYIDFSRLAARCKELNREDQTGNTTETINAFVQFLLLSVESDYEEETDDDDELSAKTVIVKNTLLREKVLILGEEPVAEEVKKPATKQTTKTVRNK